MQTSSYNSVYNHDKFTGIKKYLALLKGKTP